jgi:hypothetical protein
MTVADFLYKNNMGTDPKHTADLKNKQGTQQFNE